MKVENKKQNILIVHNYYQIPGGEDTVVKNESQMLMDHGHKVVFYTRHNSEINSMSFPRKLLLPFIAVFNFRTFFEVKKIIREEKIDIVHVHNTLSLISPAVYYAAISSHVPVVQTVHNFRLLCPGATFYRDGHICEDCVSKGLGCAIRHKCYRNSYAQTLVCAVNMWIHRAAGIYKKINYICLTEFNKEKLLSFKQIRANQIFIKPNFVSSSGLFIPEDKRKNQFIFAGRLDQTKGIDFLLEAWKKLGDAAPLLIVCGNGPLEEWCSNYIRENHLNVEMKGFLPNKEVLELVAESKALILPTRLYEGFPMCMIEAFSVGTPVIGSNLGNVGNIICEGSNGCKYKPDDKSDLLRAVKKCSNQCDSTRDVFLAQYNEEYNYFKLMEIYSTVN